MSERFVFRGTAFAGFDFDFMPIEGAKEKPEDVRATYERFWAEGGFPIWLGTYFDILTDEAFYEFWREKVHEGVNDPATAVRGQAPGAGAELLRRVQPGQHAADRPERRARPGDHPEGCGHEERPDRVRHHRARVPGKPAQMLNYPGGLVSYFGTWNLVKAAGYPEFEAS